ncbi:MAG: hypothetical protein JWM91_710, partial [Rhodospirillales bacterium]|nr:hypothetical protein [Rhodospirillales bacterium]
MVPERRPVGREQSALRILANYWRGAGAA